MRAVGERLHRLGAAQLEAALGFVAAWAEGGAEGAGPLRERLAGGRGGRIGPGRQGPGRCGSGRQFHGRWGTGCTGARRLQRRTQQPQRHFVRGRSRPPLRRRPAPGGGKPEAGRSPRRTGRGCRQFGDPGRRVGTDGGRGTLHHARLQLQRVNPSGHRVGEVVAQGPQVHPAAARRAVAGPFHDLRLASEQRGHQLVGVDRLELAAGHGRVAHLVRRLAEPAGEELVHRCVVALHVGEQLAAAHRLRPDAFGRGAAGVGDEDDVPDAAGGSQRRAGGHVDRGVGVVGRVAQQPVLLALKIHAVAGEVHDELADVGRVDHGAHDALDRVHGDRTLLVGEHVDGVEALRVGPGLHQQGAARGVLQARQAAGLVHPDQHGCSLHARQCAAAGHACGDERSTRLGVCRATTAPASVSH